MGGYATNAFVFVISTIFDLYLIAIMLRFLLQATRANFYNPVSQFLVKVTNPPLIPLRRIIPGVLGIDMAAVLLLLLVTLVKLIVILSLIGQKLSLTGLMILSVSEILNLAINVFIFSILIQVILSWVSPASGGMNPAVSLVYTLNEPILSRARALIKPIHGFDLSPIVAMVVLQVLKMVIVMPLADLASRMM